MKDSKMTSYCYKNSNGASSLRVAYKYSYLVGYRPVGKTADTGRGPCYM